MSDDQHLNLTETLLAHNLLQRPHAAALIIDKGPPEQPLQLNYQQLQQRILQFAGGLRKIWLDTETLSSPELAPQASRHVLIALSDGENFVFAFFGAIAAGLIPIPASNQLTARELAFIADDAAVNLLITDDTLELNRPVITIDPAILKSANELASYAATKAESPAYMLYTSGTTSQPKAVIHAHRVVEGRRPIISDWLGITHQDRLLHAGALNWSYTLGVGLMDSWAAGATAIVCPADKNESRDNTSFWPAAIARNRATVFAAVPGVYRQVLKQPNEPLPRQLDSLRHGVCAGEPLSEALLSQWQTVTKKRLFEALGMTECSTYISSSPNTSTRPGSAGKAQSNRLIAVLKPESKQGLVEFAAENEEGLLAIHRNELGLMLGYWQREQETLDCWCCDWFITGDRVLRDTDSYIWHCGRNSDLMNPSGYRVAPQEVETQLSALQGVAEIAVAELAVSHAQRHIVAFIVINAGFEPTEIQRQLEKTATEQLASYKQPRAYAFVGALPRTRNGKLRRADLSGLLAEAQSVGKVIRAQR